MDQKVTPFLWFDGNADEAMNFYLSVFKDSKCLSESRYSDAGPGPAGSVMVCSFEILGMKFLALNGGPMFKFNESVSFMIDCKDQEEVDYYWDKLLAGGEASACGWLKDKFGLSWQVTPRRLMELMSTDDPEANKRVMQAMMQMVKIDIPTLERAAAGEVATTS